MDRFQKNETLVAAHVWPSWPQPCRHTECKQNKDQCERRDLATLVRLINAETPYRAYIRVLCASRLTDGVTVENFAQLLRLLPNLEVLDLTKSVGLSMPIMRYLLLHSKLQLVCVIDAADELARTARQDDKLWPLWLTRVVWLGAYDFDKWLCHEQPPATQDDGAWRQCRIHHEHWFETVLLMHF